QTAADPAVVHLGRRLVVDGEDLPAPDPGGHAAFARPVVAHACHDPAVAAGFVTALEGKPDAAGGEQHRHHQAIAHRAIRTQLAPTATDVIVRGAATDDRATVTNHPPQAFDDGLLLAGRLVDPDQLRQLAGTVGRRQRRVHGLLGTSGRIVAQTHRRRAVVAI